MKHTTVLGLVIVIVTVTIIVAGLLAACAPAAPQATVPPQAQPNTLAIDGAALLNDRCTACHNLDRVKNAKKTSAQWAETVTRMVGKGAKLNAVEQKALVDYLAKTYAP